MDRETVIKQFNASINRFFTSRIIIADEVIAQYLMLVADTPVLLDIIADAMTHANYAAESARAISPKDFPGRFVMPENRNKVITLVTGLLYQFDMRERSIVEFVTEYFPDPGSHRAYLSFCETVIAPYAEAMLYALRGEPAIINTAEIEEDIALIPFPEKAREDAENWMRALLEAVQGDNTLAELDRQDALTMVKGMLYVLDMRSTVLIKITWVGLKNTLGYYKPGIRYLKELQTLLTNYGVID